jgi:hypothetical protein
VYDLQKVKALEDLLNNSPIMDIVDEFDITLDVKGRCSCLMHEETRPSMFVDFAKNKWHCFSCQHGGGPSKLIEDFYQVNYGTKNYFDALSKYLDKHPEIREELGFVDLTDKSGRPSINTLKGVKDACARLEFSKPLTRIKILEKPKLNASHIEILEYVTRLQREGK